MNISISITTYNRPAGLKNLLSYLSMQKDPLKDLNLNILIIDDCSTEDYSDCFNDIKNSEMKIDYRVTDYNHGKQRHWMIMNEIFHWYHGQKFDYALHIQDDIEIGHDFLLSMIKTFQRIPHPGKVCLNFVYDKERASRANWTPAKPEPIYIGDDKLYKTGWVDCNFFANRYFFESLGWKIKPISLIRWERNPLLSSGVGKQISNRLFYRKAGMFQVSEKIVVHGNYESVMNPEERKINPLTL